MSMSEKNHEFKETNIQHIKESQRELSIYTKIKARNQGKKDTGDIVEEILILEAALLADFVHCL